MPRGPMCSNCYVANRFFPSKDYVVIDIHCHLLPEVDDGPKSWDIAVEMCRMAATDGITHAVAPRTPAIVPPTIAPTSPDCSANYGISYARSSIPHRNCNSL